MVWRSRRGQAESFSNSSGAAFLILLITVVIVIYILFLPPADREALLSGTEIPGTSSSVSVGFSSQLGTTPLREQIGRVDYVDEDDVVHELSSFRIYSTTDANLIKEVPSLFVKNSAFEKKTQDVEFTIDKTVSENIVVSFNVFRPSGILSVYFNGDLVFEGALADGTPQPIRIPQRLLKDDNLVHFRVSTPGFAFWRTNEYTLQNIRVTGDLTDNEHSFNRQTFYIPESQVKALEESTLQFFPDCTFNTVGNMQILVNNREVYFGVPDCALKNFVSLAPGTLFAGENKIEFVSEGGNYIIDQLEVELDLIKPDYPIYYFDLHEDLFKQVADSNNFCGKVDGVCPDNCEDYEDKDCCFADSHNNYWCDIKTNNPRDRCVNQVLAEFTDRCDSGYEDSREDPPEEGEGLCGDDTDNFCPSGCSVFYDKDCCFANVNGAYWCDDVPLTGQTDVCTVAVTSAMCSACPDGYRDEDRDRPTCTIYDDVEYDDDPRVKAGVDIFMRVDFADNDFKKVDFEINGQRIPVDTYSITVHKDITPYVREGINSIQIVPRRDVDIAQLRVTVE